jgi:hypothetical protein
MSARIRVALAIATLTVLALLILVLARPSLNPHPMHPIVLVAVAWVVFGCAGWLVRGIALRVAVGLIVTGGIALQVIALAGPPQNSSDLYRYIWDGRVQVTGIDPYLYAPAAQGVAALRNDFLWSGTGAGHYVDCVTARPRPKAPAFGRVAGCTKLNKPKVQTVYPPVAEAYFAAVQFAAPADDSTTPIQAAAAGFAVLVLGVLLFGLRRLGKNPRLAALWAWCPTVPLEAGQNGHVDVLAVFFTLVALLVLAGGRTRGRVLAGGVLLGLGIATKVTPVLVMPAVLRRGWLLICSAAASAVGLVYVPHVIAVGSKIIGFFPGYLKQEGYSNGRGFSVIGLVVHGSAATAVAVVLLGLVALAIIRYGDPDQPWRGGALMTAAALAVCTPDFQWYAILLVMLVALDGRPEWLAVAAGGYLANSPHMTIHGIAVHNPRLLGYGGGAAVACLLAVARYLVERRARGGVGVAEVVAAAIEVPGVVEGANGAGIGVRADGVADHDVEVVDVKTGHADNHDVKVLDAAVVGRGAGGAGADEAGETREEVLQPTAVYGASAVIVTIGADGAPDFELAERE